MMGKFLEMTAYEVNLISAINEEAFERMILTS